MKFRTSPVTLLTPLAAAIIVAACGNSTDNNTPAPIPDILITAGADLKTTDAYAPDTFTVSLAAGGKVIFRNDDDIQHTATGNTDSASFYTGHVNPAGLHTVTFTTQGNHPFHCSIHPTMVGLVIVNP